MPNTIKKFKQAQRYYIRLFKNTDSSSLIRLNSSPIDLHYGLVDHNGNAIYPSEANIKEVKAGVDVLALDFVADAFDEFENDIERGIRINRIRGESFLTQIKPLKGWKSATEMYHEHMSLIYEIFIGVYLKKTSRHSRVKNFSDFVGIFMEFASENAGILPFTLTKFILSPECSKRISGLIIEVLKKKDNDKQYIMEKMFRDPSYRFYINMVKKHGFKIDLNVPWRLVADIRTSKMQHYMNRSTTESQYLAYGVENIPMLFDKYFYKAYRKDVLFLKKYLISFYNHFVASLPFSKKVCPGRIKVTSKFIVRDFLLEKQADKIYNNVYWALQYFRVRLVEEKIRLLVPQERRIRKNIIDITNRASFEDVVVFIGRKIDELRLIENP